MKSYKSYILFTAFLLLLLAVILYIRYWYKGNAEIRIWEYSGLKNQGEYLYKIVDFNDDGRVEKSFIKKVIIQEEIIDNGSEIIVKNEYVTKVANADEFYEIQHLPMTDENGKEIIVHRKFINLKKPLRPGATWHSGYLTSDSIIGWILLNIEEISVFDKNEIMKVNSELKIENKQYKNCIVVENTNGDVSITTFEKHYCNGAGVVMNRIYENINNKKKLKREIYRIDGGVSKESDL